jgi:hypothetical protein
MLNLLHVVFDLIFGTHNDAWWLLYAPFSFTKHRPKYKESRRGNPPSNLVNLAKNMKYKKWRSNNNTGVQYKLYLKLVVTFVNIGGE